MIRRVTTAERYEYWTSARNMWLKAPIRAERMWWAWVMEDRGDVASKRKACQNTSPVYVSSGEQAEELFGEGSSLAGWCYALTRPVVIEADG